MHDAEGIALASRGPREVPRGDLEVSRPHGDVENVPLPIDWMLVNDVTLVDDDYHEESSKYQSLTRT